MEATQHKEDTPLNGSIADPSKWQNMDKAALEKLQKTNARKSLVNLGMVKVSPDFAQQMKGNYEDYVADLPAEEQKLFKAEYYGQLMEESFLEAQDKIAGIKVDIADTYDKTIKHLGDAQEHVNKSEKMLKRNGIILIAFGMISILLLYLLYRITNKKDE